MADIDEKVLGAVEEALEKNPQATVDELFALAISVNPAVASLSKRQFHARYPLQIKRKMAPARPRKPRSRGRGKGAGRPRATTPPARDAVRATLLRFASDLTAAEARKDLVKVVAGVDRYVDDILRTTGQI